MHASANRGPIAKYETKNPPKYLDLERMMTITNLVNISNE